MGLAMLYSSRLVSDISVAYRWEAQKTFWKHLLAVIFSFRASSPHPEKSTAQAMFQWTGLLRTSSNAYTEVLNGQCCRLTGQSFVVQSVRQWQWSTSASAISQLSISPQERRFSLDQGVNSLFMHVYISQSYRWFKHKNTWSSHPWISKGDAESEYLRRTLMPSILNFISLSTHWPFLWAALEAVNQGKFL